MSHTITFNAYILTTEIDQTIAIAQDSFDTICVGIETDHGYMQFEDEACHLPIFCESYNISLTHTVETHEIG